MLIIVKNPSDEKIMYLSESTICDLVNLLDESDELIDWHGSQNGIDCGCDRCELHDKIKSVLHKVSKL